jgi:uncharacterized protein (TIGR00725 family)
MDRKPVVIAVAGHSEPDEATRVLARDVGRFLGERGVVMVCGGLGGVMEAAAQGVKEGGGMTIGILPGYDKSEASAYIDIPIPTGMGHARNVIVAAASDVLIAFQGEHGTRSEVSIALRLGRKVVGVRAWREIPTVEFVESLSELARCLSPFLPPSPSESR